jgi:transcriptional regulator with XRE-family HTH domain
MTPDELLLLYPRETLRWLRRRLGMSRADLPRYLQAVTAPVAAWEAGETAIAPLYHARLAALLAPYLATPEGEAFARSLGRGGESGDGC